ncbi:hypothetical protein PPACK8108_LOCUS2033 [Phakopsora pachyrhizi]|uniref:Uncharacterized protein n=1 Tax=Phakopsora pachyrhizi TaxID=170000 RepID=A0AAV0AI32_PHAPC|nr:hypothetical protein PPACK8108_LOCUS2033 [Phakopsora pachyrhizi]
MPVKKDRREKGRNRRKGDVDIAGPRAADNILQGRQHIAGPKTLRVVRGSGGDVRIDNRRGDKGKNALRRTKVCLTDKEAVGREEAGVGPKLTTSYEKR